MSCAIKGHVVAIFRMVNASVSKNGISEQRCEANKTT
jgi:hypothetical protein